MNEKNPKTILSEEISQTLVKAKNRSPWVFCLAMTRARGGRLFVFDDLVRYELVGISSFITLVPSEAVANGIGSACELDTVIISQKSLSMLPRVLRQPCEIAFVNIESLDGKPDFNLPLGLVDYQTNLESLGLEWEDLELIQTIPLGLMTEMSLASKSNELLPALFLDRDGIINEDRAYVSSPDQIVLVPGIVELIAKAHQKGMKVIVITNQSGIGRGLYTEVQYDQVTMKIRQLLAEKGQWLDEIEYAAFHEQAMEIKFWNKKFLRKPRSGMIAASSIRHRVDLKASVLVGDKATDILAGLLIGVGHCFLLESKIYQNEVDQVKRWNDEFGKFENLKLMFSNLKNENPFQTVKALNEVMF